MLPHLSSDTIVGFTLNALGIFSVTTWTVVFFKIFQHLRAVFSNRRYMHAFWGASSLSAAYAFRPIDGSAARIAAAGFEVLASHPTAQDLAHSGERRDLLERCLRQQLQRERRALEGGLALLASIGSTAPFVGLFGTVWGIMNALHEITRVGNASLDVVAGPIGDALIATAIGIGVAVPAVLAYNFFLRRMKIVVAELDDFATDFLNLAGRQGFHLGREDE